MCGIFGGTNHEWNYEALLSVLRHRGPDLQKCTRIDNLSLGFTRLAIIDLSSKADQPMSNIEKDVWIVFNGEIYGYKVLRQELISMGYRFQSESDTEVILNAYIEWGDKYIEHIDGMFSIAIYDSRVSKLKLWRDRTGIKPLYYYWNGKHFGFASELKGITHLCKDVSSSFDKTAIYDYLTYGYIPEPKTLYKNVYKLLPAHHLTFSLVENRIESINSYWQLKVEPNSSFVAKNDVYEHLRFLIRESIRDQLVADVPVGCFLSGGVDSSVVVAEASRLKPDLKTFSIGFEDQQYSEVHFAQQVAKYFAVFNKCKILSKDFSNNLFNNLRRWFDEPFSDISAVPSFLVAEHASKYIKVVLTGDGGDEVFGGYPRYNRILSYMKHRVPNKLLNLVLMNSISSLHLGNRLRKMSDLVEIFTGEELAFYTIITMGMTTAYKKQYAREWGIPKDYDTYWYFRKYYRPDLPLLTRLQYLDFHTYLPSDILTKVDRVTMAVSLEARVPLLSKKIVEFVFSLPESIRFYNEGGSGLWLKGLLKEAYKEILPSNIIARRKMGFAIPPKYLSTNGKTIEEMILSDFFGIATLK